MKTNIDLSKARGVPLTYVEVDIQTIDIFTYNKLMQQVGRGIGTDRSSIAVGLDTDSAGKPIMLLRLYHPTVGVMSGVLRDVSVGMLAHKIAEYVDIAHPLVDAMIGGDVPSSVQ